MIVNSSQQASSGQMPGSPVADSVPMRNVAPNAANVQLRRADSTKSGSNLTNSNINNSLNLPNTNRNTNKNKPSQFANTSGSVSLPSMINTLPGSYNTTTNVTTQSEPSRATDTSLPPHVVCSRYFLFLVYLLLLLSLIVNTFLHFLFYGSNMSIGALFLDVHHRHELVTGDYYSLDPYTNEAQLNWPDFKNYARPNQDQRNRNEEELYYSSSSTSGEKMDSVRASRVTSPSESQWKRRTRHEQRLLAIEVVALILLFVTVLTQVFGLIGVLKRNLVILLLVTVVDSLILSALIFVANLGLILLLLLAICVGFYFVFQLKVGIDKEVKHNQKQRELVTSEVRNCINASCGRLTPCIHVSMEQYEAMTQQMLHRYSSPIVYCPHYNESLC